MYMYVACMNACIRGWRGAIWSDAIVTYMLTYVHVQQSSLADRLRLQGRAKQSSMVRAMSELTLRTHVHSRLLD